METKIEQTFVQQMAEMKDKADKYEHLRKRFDEILDKLKQINNQIYDIMVEARPETIRTHGTRLRNQDEHIEVIDYAIKYMHTGKYLTLVELTKAFPDRTPNSLAQIFYMKLPKINKILSTKINNNKNYYFQQS